MKLRSYSYLLLLTILFIFFGCKPEPVVPEPDPEPETLYPSEIKAGQTSGSGIQYLDIRDTTIYFDYPSSGGEIALDLNGDQIDDFKITHFGSASPGHSISNSQIIPLNQNGIVVSNLNWGWADTLSTGVTIDNGSNWVSDTCLLYSFSNFYQGTSSSAGLWSNVSEKFVGTRIDLGSHYLYGWIKCRITNGWNPTVLEYATTVGYTE